MEQPYNLYKAYGYSINSPNLTVNRERSIWNKLPAMVDMTCYLSYMVVPIAIITMFQDSKQVAFILSNTQLILAFILFFFYFFVVWQVAGILIS